MTQEILSTGIDIGTTTTHLIVSRLVIAVKEGFGCAPKVEIEDKEIIYMSQIYFTPLESDGRISAKGVKNIIDSEYKKAKISPDMLKSGAVIITGESARRRNAKELLFEISKYAGDFIIAEAGGDTESVLAGKGVGGQELSADELCRVCTVDIGGGTTNIALFEDGEAVAASCIDAGGRLIQVNCDKSTAVISEILPSVRPLLDENKIDIEVGAGINPDTERKICDALVARIINELEAFPKADKYIFSGGVSACMGEEYSKYRFGDFGVLLAEKLKSSDFFTRRNCSYAKNSIRATVIGAGNFSFEISGSTIACLNCSLPIKNIPCVKINVTDSESLKTACARLASRIAEFSPKKPVAISFDGFSAITADEMLFLAKETVDNSAELIKNRHPLIVLIDKDIGKAFGICLKRLLPADYPVLCIDCVSAGDNDYLDIGESVGGGKAVPVSVKQLVFSV